MHPNPQALVEAGDLLGQGARLVFPDCYTTERRVLLYTIDYLAGGEIPYALEIAGQRPLAAPTITLCQSSGRVEQRAIGANAYFDPNRACHAPLPTATHAVGWSQIKRLFR